MPALIKRPRAPLTCNNQLTCLKRHLFKNTCFSVCGYDSYYENVFVMWCVFRCVFVWRFACPNLVYQKSIWYALVEYLDEGRSNLPEKNQISGQIYRRPSSNLKYLQRTLIRPTIFTEKPHQIYNIYRRPSSHASGVISHQLDIGNYNKAIFRSSPGWQNLAAFRREQKWQWKLSSNAYLQFSRQMRRFCA